MHARMAISIQESAVAKEAPACMQALAPGGSGSGRPIDRPCRTQMPRHGLAEGWPRGGKCGGIPVRPHHDDSRRGRLRRVWLCGTGGMGASSSSCGVVLRSRYVALQAWRIGTRRSSCPSAGHVGHMPVDQRGHVIRASQSQTGTVVTCRIICTCRGQACAKDALTCCH